MCLLTHETQHGEVSDVVTWVDDIALAVNGNASELMSKVPLLLSIVQDTMLEHGLELSYVLVRPR